MIIRLIQKVTIVNPNGERKLPLFLEINMYLKALIKHDKRRILDKYKTFSSAADDSSNCPAHRRLMANMRDRMLLNSKERNIIDRWLCGHINDEGENI